MVVLFLLVSFLFLTSQVQGQSSGTLECLIGLGEKVNQFQDGQCLLDENSTWTMFPDDWQVLKYGRQSCCMYESIQTDRAISQINQVHVQNEVTAGQLGIYYTNFVANIVDGSLNITIEFYHSNMTLMNSTEEIYNEFQYQGVITKNFLIPKQTEFIQVTLLITGNLTLCFDHLFLEIIDSSTWIGNPLKLYVTVFNFLVYALILSTVIPLILMYEWTLSPFELKYIGIEGPKLLEEQKSRFIPTLLFAVSVQPIFNYSLQFAFGTDAVEGILRIVTFLVTFLVSSFLYWPLFVCYEQRKRKLSSVSAIIVTLNLLVLRFLSELTVANNQFIGKLFVVVPEIVGLLVVLFFFILQLVKENQPSSLLSNFYQIHQQDFNYVSEFFQKSNKPKSKNYQYNNLVSVPKGISRSFTEWMKFIWSSISSFFIDGDYRKEVIETYIWKDDYHFRFPQRLLASIIMIIVILYDFSVFFVSSIFQYSSEISCSLAHSNDLDLNEIVEMATFFEGIILRNSIGIMIVSLLIGVSQFYAFLVSFKQDYLSIRKGAKHLFLLYHPNMDDALKFIGFQFGFMFIGIAVNIALVTCIFIIFILLVNSEGVWEFFWKVLIQNILLIPIIFTVLWRFLQTYLTKKLLFPDSLFDVKHHKLFQHFDFAVIFVNIIRSLLSYTIRILYGLLSLFFYSSRLDSLVVTNSFHSLDIGHRTYLGLLVVAHYYNNPIVCTFVYCLFSTVHQDSNQGVSKQNSMGFEKEANESSVLQPLLYQDYSGIKVSPISFEKTSSRARNKFLLAITLSNNPSLIPLRKHNLVINNQEE